MDKQIVLIVDDIELNRAILAELFHERFRIEEASNGKEALEAIDRYEDRIAVVLLDLVMPIMDGIEVLKELNRDRRIDRIPVVMITAENSEDTALLGYSMGVSDIIDKPFNPDIVLKRVQNIVELYNHKHRLEKILSDQLQKLEDQARRLKSANDFVIDTLSTVVEFRNGESGTHIRRIRSVTRTLLEELAHTDESYRLSATAIETIASASALHDLGKIAIPDAVLMKPGKLTQEEFEIMKTHTIRGCELLEALNYDDEDDFYRYSYDICRHHHERWDGNGYPDGLRGNEISIWAQVVALADVYDALTSERVYKPAYSHEQAVAMICEGECGAFNPVLIECFQQSAESLKRGNAEETPVVRNNNPEERGHLSERTLRLLELEREKYRVLSEMSGDITFDYDVASDTIQFSEKYIEVFDGNFRIRNLRAAVAASKKVSEEDKSYGDEICARLTREHPNGRYELKLKTKNGLEWFEVFVTAVWRSGDDNYVSIIGKLSNIHEKKMEREKLIARADRDSLTGLFNRAAFERKVGRMLARRPNLSALIFCDVDRFKTLNDTCGHGFGDSVLQSIARRLKEVFAGEHNLIGRIGGDEFVIYLGNPSSRQQLKRMAEEACSVFRESFLDEGSDVISGSVGIACYPTDGKDYGELLNHADRALYEAKRAGRNRSAFYSSSMQKMGFSTAISEMDSATKPTDTQSSDGDTEA